MSQVDLAIHGGTVVTPSGRARLHVYVRDGRIVDIGPQPLEADHVVDATGLHVLPGMVDTHVHLMDPGDPSREDFPTGTSAAAARGITTIVEHTHGHPVRTLAELEDKRGHLEGRSHVDYGLAAHVWPEHLRGLAELWAAGITFYKIFTCTTHGVPGLEPATLKRALETIAGFGGACLLHCEDETITEDAERMLRAAGRDDGAVVFEWRSREAELVAVGVAAELVRLTGAHATIAHVSNPEAARLIARARADGADLAAEACPQYLLLREDEILTEGAFRKFTPPARARTDADEDEMWALLRSGVLTHVSTDHAPATRAQKEEGSIWDVHFGLPGLDTTLPALLDATARGKLALEDVVRLYSAAPARRYGLGAKGRLTPGADADLVLVDVDGQWTVSDEDVISKAGWTPYAGRRFRGAVVATYLRGRSIAEGGPPDGEPHGRFLPGPGAV